MKKLHAAWIVLIVFCSSIVIGGIFYLFYRLYINHIYKRRRVWNEITSPMTKKTEEMREERVDVLAPRPSIIPLIQELLPNDWRRRTERRKTVTQLQFSEPPVFEKNFINEWEEMDGRSSLSSPTLMSTRTSYYTIQGGSSTHETTKFDEEYLLQYFSMSSIDPLISPIASTELFSSIGDNSRQQSPLNLMNYSSNNKRNNSFNHIVLDLELMERINRSNNLYKLSELLFNLTKTSCSSFHLSAECVNLE